MKLPIKLILLALVFGLIGCEKQVDNPAVETYINQLPMHLLNYQFFNLLTFQHYLNTEMKRWSLRTFLIMGFHLFGHQNVS
jgi:hypothetical protein